MPRIILQRIDNYFDLNSAQENYIKSRIAIHHKWHRETQLRLYLADLKDLRRRFDAGFKESDLEWLTARLKLHRDSIFIRVIPDLVNALQTLDQNQITHLEKKLSQENKELEEKLSRPLALRQKEEFALIVKEVEDWAGKLSEEQKAQLLAKYASIPAGAMDWLRYREEQQAVFVKLLRSKPDHARLKEDLEGRMVHQERNLPQRFRASFARTFTLMKEMILTADRILIPKQRLHVLRKADDYIQILSELADGA